MLANWVKETTTTTGTGNITLAGAVSNFIRFQDAFLTNQMVEYFIEDANGDKEHGYGKLTAATTLARSIVKATIVSGTLDNTSPTALTLSAGTHTVQVAPSSAIVAPPPVIPHSLGTNYVVLNSNWDGASNGQAYTANTLYFTPIYNASPRECSHLWVTCSAVVSGSLQIGIYNWDTDGLPGNLLARTANITAATGVNSNAINGGNIYLQPGWYYLALCTDQANSYHRRSSVHDSLMTPCGLATNQTSGVSSEKVYSIAFTFADLPAAPTVTVANGLGISRSVIGGVVEV